MSFTFITFSMLALGIIVGGVLVLIKKNGKFNLTNEQLDKVKKRNQQLNELEKED